MLFARYLYDLNYFSTQLCRIDNLLFVKARYWSLIALMKNNNQFKPFKKFFCTFCVNRFLLFESLKNVYYKEKMHGNLLTALLAIIIRVITLHYYGTL